MRGGAPPHAPQPRERAEPRLADKAWSVELERMVERELRGKAYEPTFASVQPGERCFVLDTPPPYPSGRWHIGAVAHYTLIDMIARSRRMLGERVLFPWGLDRNGINIELVVERKHKRPMGSFPRAEFLELCAREIEPYSQALEEVARRVGMSCDFAHGYRTDSPEYRALTQRTFIELWRKGAVTQELRPNNYCPDCRTTIADAEVLREERRGKLYTVRWQVSGPGGGERWIEVATTRPELIGACGGVLVHPDDVRYGWLRGEGPAPEARVPLCDRSVPVRSDASVDPHFGTGAMMICSYGDFHDVEMFRKHGFAPVAAIGPDGRMTEHAFPGLDVKGKTVLQARDFIVALLRERKLLVKEEEVSQQLPICERSKTPIEIISLKEWYLKQVEAVGELRRIAEAIEFHPPKHRQILLDWLDTITIDWPVSRRRYYHTEIPVWYCRQCGEPHVPEPGRYYQPWREPAPPEVAERGCRKCGAKGTTNFVGEEKVFDTWMDSSGSNLWVTKYAQDPGFFEVNFPCAIRPQGRDIVRTWLHYTLLKSFLLLGKPGFRHVWITGLGMDEQGRKMSKSLGNVIEPEAVLEEFGADAFRFWAAAESTIGDDFRISKDRIRGARNFLTKLYNVARFISSFPVPARPANLHPVDEWVLAELNRLIQECRAGYEEFNFFRPATALRHFVWSVFAPHYVEMAKRRAYEGDGSARWTLHEVLRACLLLLAPVCPFLTYKLHATLYGGDPHEARFPEPVPGIDASLVDKTGLVEAFNSEVWKRKKERRLPLNAPIEGVEVPLELAAFKDSLVAMHNLR